MSQTFPPLAAWPEPRAREAAQAFYKSQKSNSPTSPAQPVGERGVFAPRSDSISKGRSRNKATQINITLPAGVSPAQPLEVHQPSRRINSDHYSALGAACPSCKVNSDLCSLSGSFQHCRSEGSARVFTPQKRHQLL